MLFSTCAINKQAINNFLLLMIFTYSSVTLAANPVAIEDIYPLDESTLVTVGNALVISEVDVLANDTDADGDTLTVLNFDDPVNGTLAQELIPYTDPETGIERMVIQATFTPTAVGIGRLTYTLSDSGNNNNNYDTMDWGVVTINVNREEGVPTPPEEPAQPVGSSEPTVENETFYIVSGEPLETSEAILLSNDVPNNGQALFIEFLDDWDGGTANFDSTTRAITFTPNAGFTGTGTFTYTVYDGLHRNWGRVNIVVGDGPSPTPPEEPTPPAEEPIPLGGEPTVINEVFYVAMNERLDTLESILLSNDVPNNGQALFIEFLDDWEGGNASFNAGTGAIIFTPNTGFIGTGTFTYTVYDGIDRGWGRVNVIVGDGASLPPAEEPTPPEEDPVPPIEHVFPGGEPVVINNVSQYTFNHSLWNHVSGINTNTVTGYWVGEFALSSATTYAWNGQYGQLDYHSLPPSPQLSSGNSADVYPSENTEFSDLDLDNILIMPPNFGQNSDITASPQHIAHAQRVIDWVVSDQMDEGGQSGIPIYIYEHWQEAPNNTAYPLNATQWSQYHAVTTGTYHQWFLDYQNQLASLYPGVDFRMIPVGPVIADILQSSLQASDFEFADLYEDNDPHGTTDLYFLAGLVTYQAMYGQPVNANYTPPSTIDTRIANDFTALNDFVWQRLNHYNQSGVSLWPAGPSID
ncbi:MAG: hypothetical protein ACJA2B_001723 [Candidatus Endobugula sp.]|jgi:hypothetical protein